MGQLEGELAGYPVSERGVDDLHRLLGRLDGQKRHEDETLAARRLLEVCEELYGAQHFETSVAHSLIAAAARKAGKWQEASEEYEWMADFMSASDKVPAQSKGAILANWGKCLFELGELERALTVLDQAIEVAPRQDDRFALRAESIKWHDQDASWQLQRARELFEEVDEASMLATRAGSTVTDLLIDLLLEQKDPEAVKVQERKLEATRRAHEKAHQYPVWLEEQNLGTVQARVGDREVAGRLLTTAFSKLVAELGEDHWATELTRKNMAKYGFDEPRPEEVEEQIKPYLLARCFFQRAIKMGQIAERMQRDPSLQGLEIREDTGTAEVVAPGLHIRMVLLDRLKDVMAEAKELPSEADRKRARQQFAVIRVEVKITPKYKGVDYGPSGPAMGSVAGGPAIPTEGLALCEYLGREEGASVHDEVLGRWYGDP
jgi:tetratricopeptide (TPR) repeat protein